MKTELSNHADMARIKQVVYARHKVRLRDDDPMLIMLTMAEEISHKEREFFAEATRLYREQSQSQLTPDTIRRFTLLLNKKANPDYRNILLGAGVALAAVLITMLTTSFWYEPAKVGNQFLSAWPHMDAATQANVQKAMIREQ